MSGSTTPRPAGQPKVMTSRLMNMKFMQRAAASSPLSPDTPAQTPDQSSAKRRKLDHSLYTPTSTGTSTPILNDSRRRESRLESNETEWVLHPPQPNTNGHSPSATSSSSSEDELWAPTRSIGRQTYGTFKRRKTTVAAPQPGDEDLSSLESGEKEDLHPLRPMKRPRDREQEEEAQGRRMDRMNLSRMGGVSGSSAMTGAGMSKSKRKDGGGEKHKHGRKKDFKRGPDSNENKGKKKKKTV